MLDFTSQMLESSLTLNAKEKLKLEKMKNSRRKSKQQEDPLAPLGEKEVQELEEMSNKDVGITLSLKNRKTGWAAVESLMRFQLTLALEESTSLDSLTILFCGRSIQKMPTLCFVSVSGPRPSSALAQLCDKRSNPRCGLADVRCRCDGRDDDQEVPFQLSNPCHTVAEGDPETSSTRMSDFSGLRQLWTRCGLLHR